MNRKLKLIAILLALIMLTLPVLGEMGGMSGMNNDNMRGKAKDMHEKGSEIRNAEGMKGMGFMHREGNSYGQYVTFTVNDTTGDVWNYGISGLPVFDSIKVSSFNVKDITTMGSITRITSKDGSVVIQLHDNPAAVINIRTKATATVIFNLSEGVNATKEDNIIKIVADNLTAYIASTNATSVNIADGEIKIVATNGNMIFRALPFNMPMDGREFMGEMMRNRAGAEVSVGESDKYSIVNYSDDMNVMIRSMEKNRMRMTVNSENHSGKFLIMNIDNSSLMWNERQKIRLYLDNKPMRQVMSEQELYNADESSYWLNMMGNNRMQAMMYISNFSEHQVDIVVEDVVTSTPTETPGVTITTVSATPKAPGFEIIIGLAGAAVAYRLRRKL